MLWFSHGHPGLRRRPVGINHNGDLGNAFALIKPGGPHQLGCSK